MDASPEQVNTIVDTPWARIIGHRDGTAFG